MPLEFKLLYYWLMRNKHTASSIMEQRQYTNNYSYNRAHDIIEDYRIRKG